MLSRKSRSGKWRRYFRRSREGRERYEKGHLFETVVAKFFEYKGYRVGKNVRVRGLSGALHEVDIVLERNGRLVGVVEAKNYDKPVPKEWVMKIYEVGRDVGALEVYVVSASGFTEDAEKVARVLGVQLLNLDDMIREVERVEGLGQIPILHVKPVYDENTAKEYASRHARRRLFKPVEEATHVSLVYVPFYLVEGEYVYLEERGLIFTRQYEVRRRVQLLALASGLSMLYCEEDLCELVEIPLLSDEEAKLLSTMLSLGEGLYYDDLEEETGWSRSKLSRVVNSLVDKGLVEVEEDENGRKIFTTVFPALREFEESTRIILEEASLVDGAPSGGEVREVTVPPSNIKALVKRLFNIEVKDAKILYLPVYRVKLESLTDETYRYICLLAAQENMLLEPCID